MLEAKFERGTRITLTYYDMAQLKWIHITLPEDQLKPFLQKFPYNHFTTNHTRIKHPTTGERIDIIYTLRDDWTEKQAPYAWQKK